MAGEQGAALVDIPNLWPCFRGFQINNIGCPSYHATHVPYIDTIRPRSPENNFRGAIDVRLNELCEGPIAENRGPKVAEDWGTQWFGHLELLGHVEESPIGVYFFPWNGVLELPFFKVAEDGIVVDAEHDVVGFDI